jgi:hypothetical protein
VITLKIQLGSFTGTRTVNRTLIPVGVDLNIVGSPCVVRMSGLAGPADGSVVQEVRTANFAPGEGPADQVAAVAAGRFSPGLIPDDLR